MYEIILIAALVVLFAILTFSIKKFLVVDKITEAEERWENRSWRDRW
jgi:hypothetical protein